jgi:YidC/Oxa1 family membrane protein insertase
MDSQRLILLTVFFFSLYMLFQAWEKEHAPKITQAAAAGKSDIPGSVPGPGASSSAAGAKAQLPAAAAGNTTAARVARPVATAVATPAKSERVTIKTDFLVAEIDESGATLTRLEFTKHLATQEPHDLIHKVRAMLGMEKSGPDDADHAAGNFVLLEQNPEHTYLAQSGLAGGVLPNQDTPFTLQAGPRELADGADKLEVRLDASAGGVKLTKVFVFHRSSYLIDVRMEVMNQGATALQPTAYFQFVRDGHAADAHQPFMSSFTGPAFYTDAEKYEKLDFADIDSATKAQTKVSKVPADSSNGWAAMVQHYFVSAWLPPPAPNGQAIYSFYAKKVNDTLYSVGVKFALGSIAPGATAAIDMPMYSGPEEQDKLAVIAPGLDRVVDYGKLSFIAEPLFWVLEWLHRWVLNWGVAIILLTCMIKAIFFPLSAASYKSMARMRLVSPRLAKLKEQYGDDRMKMNQAMMELYKTEKINPLGGCLPILVQIPVFMALYWVLLGSVEMRNAPFYGWIHDLSARDPYCVLPIVMTATSYIQIKLNPPPPDPVQAKVMLIMPLAFGVMFFFFPAGLVLYWVVNNLLSIAQQWQITRMIESGKDPAKSDGKGGNSSNRGNKDRPKR